MEYLLRLGDPGLSQAPLEYGAKYKLYREGVYLGEGVYTDDEHHGNVFLNIVDDVAEVYCADEWVLIL